MIGARLAWVSLFAVVVLVGRRASAADFTYFRLNSTPGSWVGQGLQNYLIDLATGGTFTAQRNYDNGVSFRMIKPGAALGDWYLDLAAPFDAQLVPGMYENTARWPFQATGQPGLTLSGNGHGNNTNGGFFKVLEAVYNTDGSVQRFAVDFTQLGERRADWQDVGELRYHSTVPEPAGLAVGLLAVALGCPRRRRAGTAV